MTKFQFNVDTALGSRHATDVMLSVAARTAVSSVELLRDQPGVYEVCLRSGDWIDVEEEFAAIRTLPGVLNAKLIADWTIRDSVGV